MKDLSIIIVSYNTRDLTLSCLESVYRETKGLSFEVIVVDNNSSDDSAEAIAKAFPRVKLVRSETNLGFARANNRASEVAYGKYLLLLNPDTFILNQTITRLHQFAISNPEYQLYGGRTLFEDLTLNPTSCWGKPTLWSYFCCATGLTALFRNNRFFNPKGYGSWQRDSLRTVDIVTGCFLLIQKSLWERLGGFDKKFFMYAEDADLCIRAKRSGASLVIYPEATIIHICGASEKVRKEKLCKLFRAKITLIRTHWPTPKIQLGIFFLLLAIFFRYKSFQMVSAITAEKVGDRFHTWEFVWKQRTNLLSTS